MLTPSSVPEQLIRTGCSPAQCGGTLLCVCSWEHRECLGPSSPSPRVSSWRVTVALERRMKYTGIQAHAAQKSALSSKEKIPSLQMWKGIRGIFSCSHVVYVLPVGWQLFRRTVHGNSGTQMWNIRSNKIHTCF